MPSLMNAWSLLYEELKMSENFEDRYEDSLKSPYWYDYDRNDPNRVNPFMGTVSGAASSDTIFFGAAQAAQQVPMDYLSPDCITFDMNPDPDSNNNPPTTKGRKKYNEDEILKEVGDYISGTYGQHYSNDGFQTLDLIEACGDGESFCRSNILKYASRYDKKGTARRDIMKILHYAVLLLHFNDKNAQRETYPQ
tara:strand:+ start:552 stop:1133 length:582 start_codon:yes stop_codon:yes gene_type:complete